MKSLTQIADQIAVCPVPGDGHRFNGLSSLSETGNRIEPLLADLAPSTTWPACGHWYAGW